ncbi:MAG: hypothetical protein NC212_05675 [Staphylococcus sp.]|nr:hypothetical protein [Staphylococcus sp.]
MRYSVILFFCVVLASCGLSTGKAGRALELAEAVMDERPDSALTLLRALGPDDCRGDRQRAMYHLLLTQAESKLFMEIPDDSVVSLAIDYFDRIGDKYHLMMAYHYQGQINSDLGNHPKGLFASMLAYDLAVELDEKFWIAISARTISNIYHETFNGLEDIRFAHIEYDNFKAINKQPHTNYALMNLAKAYFMDEKYDKTLSYSKEALDSAYVCNDDFLKAEALRTMGVSYMSKDDYDESIKAFGEVCHLSSAEAEDSIYLAISYIKNGLFRSHRDFIDSVPESDRKSLNLWLQYEKYLALDSIEKALVVVKERDSERGKLVQSMYTRNISGTVLNYHEYNTVLKNAQLRASRVKLYSVIAGCLIICVIVVVVIFRYRARQRILMDSNVEIAHKFQKLIATKEDSFRETVQALFEDRFKELDNLCRIFYENPNSSIAKKRISDEVESLINHISKDKDKYLELISYADKHYDGMVTKFYSEFPRLKDVDYRMFLYSILGFSNSAIALFLGEDRMSAIYSRRKRLKNRIKESDSEYKDYFLDVLG